MPIGIRVRRHPRTFLVWGFIALVVATIAWGATYSPSYRKCLSDHANQDRKDKQSNLNEPVKGGAGVEVVPVFVMCEGAFIDENNGTLTAIATIFIAAFTLTLWRATNRLWESGEKQIDVAQKSAIAALRQANAVVALESPIPVIAGIKLVQYLDRFAKESMADPITAGPVPDFCRVLTNFINIGRSPMRVDGFSIEWEITRDLPAERRYRNTRQPWDTWLRERESVWFRVDPQCEIELTADQHRRIRDGQEHLWVYGRVFYSNFMKEHSIIGFSFRWNLANGFERIQHTAYNYEENASGSEPSRT
jgi:hypothetical protein